MSRSRRRTPKRTFYTQTSEKEYKVIWHQMMRAAIRQALHHAQPDEVLLPHEREVFSDFDFGKAGRYWFDSKENPKRMRK